MEREVVLSAENFNSFLRCLSLFKEPVCNDIDIKSGILRQRTNDRFAIFEVDLTSLINDITIPIVSLKNKLEILKCLQDREVKISIDDRSFSFSDDYSIFRFENPDISFMDNTFITDNDFANLFTLTEDAVILKYTMPKTISDRMRVTTAVYSVNSVQLLFEGETCSITARTASKDQLAKFVSGILLDQPINASSSIVSTPFVSDHDGDIKVKSYQLGDQVCITKFTMDVSNIAVNIFARSPLVMQE